MLISPRLPPTTLTTSSVAIYDSNMDRHHVTNANAMVPPTSLPKYFNVPFAIQHGYFRCIRYLLQLLYDPNERDSQLRTPLILCAYVENDRWSLSLAQNLLEKGAKIALDDHARRNAMHHACALQRLHLVQLYLSCLDFNIEAKDCEGNTCLHYVAITGNCEMAELLMRSAEKLGIRLDQYVNRDGCSAAVLALKYGHIECANQITHRDSDEFFVIPRPLSIYETLPMTDDTQQVTSTTVFSKKKRKNISNNLSPNKTDTHSLTTSFGLLKIIFNESDTGYSTRLADLCKQEKRIRQHQRSKHKKHEALQTSTSTINKLDRTKSTVTNGIHYCSTEALVNETQLSSFTKDLQTSYESNGNPNSSNRTSPRTQLLIQQYSPSKSNFKETSSFIEKTNSKVQLQVDDTSKTKFSSPKNDSNETKSKISMPTINRQASNSTLNPFENNLTKSMSKFEHSKAGPTRHSTLANPASSRLHSAKMKSTLSPKKKSTLNDRIDSASNSRKNHQTFIDSESSTYSQMMYDGHPVSTVMHPSVSRSTDASYAIREAKGKSNLFNKPERLFGLRPEELFAAEQQYQPKIFDQRSHTKFDDHTRLKRSQIQKQQHLWQQDVEKVIELYNVHHCTNYRKSAVPPSSTQHDTTMESTNPTRPRRMSITKICTTNSTKPTMNPKQSTYAALNIPRRNSISRPPIKLTNS